MVSNDDHYCFVGTYTDGESDGIYECRIDGTTGRIERSGVTESENPAFLAFHPTEEYLYATNNLDDGTVTAFSVDASSGTLTAINGSSIGDAGPCHCSVDATGSYVLTAQYHGGSVSMLPIDSDGGVGDRTCLVEHEGSSVHPDRQTEPHPHSITPGPQNEFAYAPDLGTDEIVVYELALDEGRLRPAETGAVAVHDGAGPRHMEFHPNGEVAYLVNELDSTVVAYDYNESTGALEKFATVDTLPASVDVENYPADVHVHPSGDVLYASNRGHDSIAVFELDERGTPSRTGTVSTRGEWPRNFAIAPDGDFLFAENQHTDTVVTFRIDDTRLEPTGDVVEIPEPVCLEILQSEAPAQ